MQSKPVLSGTSVTDLCHLLSSVPLVSVAQGQLFVNSTEYLDTLHIHESSYYFKHNYFERLLASFSGTCSVSVSHCSYLFPVIKKQNKV